jgi:hypothetical protein
VNYKCEPRREQRLARTIAGGKVAIDGEAIGVNYADGVVRMGLYASARRLRRRTLTSPS